MLWGVVVGAVQAATPLLFWWLDSAVVYALGLAVIGAIYVGFAVADGRVKVIAVETSVAFSFVIIGAAALTGTPWLLVVAFVRHGLKDLWQHRTRFVANTRWWPPFCMTVDWVVAAIIAVEIAAGPRFRESPPLCPRNRPTGASWSTTAPVVADASHASSVDRDLRRRPLHRRASACSGGCGHR